MVEVLRKMAEENGDLKVEVAKLEKEKEKYEDVLRKTLKNIDELIEEIHSLKG